jgi:nucleoside-diphosphate-sugar epimerase
MRETILVTGAGGFIGGRVVEVLYGRGEAEVRAGVRRWSTAARIGRLPIEIVPCDLLDAAQVDAAMRGATAVVHCAVGDRAATVDGTRNVMDAALRHGVRRVVHLSTIDVYGGAAGTVLEDAPLVETGAAYGDSKIAAERVCQEYAAKGLSVVMLRPTIVYGPFSESWTMEFAQRMLGGRWLLPESDCNGRCNLVYVDDLVLAVLRALEAEGVDGRAFNVNGPDHVTWNEYFRALAGSLGLPRLEAAGRGASHVGAMALMPVRKAAKLALKHFGAPIMWLYQRNAVVKRLMRKAEHMIRQTPTTNEFRMYSRTAHYPTDRARDMLGYAPNVDMQRGVELSAAWLRHHRIVTPARTHAAG